MQTLYIEHAEMMFRLAWKYTGSASDAEDVVSGACETLISNLEIIRPLPSRLQVAYIHASVKRQALQLKAQRQTAANALRQQLSQAADETEHLPEDMAIAHCTLQEVR